MIVNAEVSKERRAEICVMYPIRDGCFHNVGAQAGEAGEDDFFDPLHTTLKALGLKNICLYQRADWQEELRPVVPQKWHFNILAPLHRKVSRAFQVHPSVTALLDFVDSVKHER